MRPLLLLFLLSGCSSESYLPKSADTGYGGSTSSTSGDFTDGSDQGDTGANTIPPEEEDDYLRLAPASTVEYVFIANPDRDTVTRIAVPGLEVVTVPVGSLPSTVMATPDGKLAVTLNEGSDDLSILDAETLAEVRVPIRDRLNRLSISVDGHWAMCWYDPDADSLGTSDGIQSYSEVSFVDLTTVTHWPMAVGFLPKNVQWTADGKRALVVSDASLALVELTEARLVPKIITLSEDPMDAPEAEEVEISPDGHYAFVRQRGSSEVMVVDLDTLSFDRVPVGDDPSDMDVSPDGRQLAVVARGAAQLWLLDPTNPFGTPEIVDMPAGGHYGSLQFLGAGDRGVLYTTATLEDRFAIWDQSDDSVDERLLVKPIRSVSVSADGSSLLVFHTEEDAPHADPTSPFRGKWAMTQVNLEDLRSNPLLLPAEPMGYTVSDDGRYGWFIMDGQNLLESLDFSTLLNQEVRLPSTPVHVGTLPGTATAWVSQEHDVGRISFYDSDAATLDTITGFELNSGIDHQ